MGNQGIRLSTENYCNHCVYKLKTDSKRAWCEEYNQALLVAREKCRLLKPFKHYEQYRISKRK